ncbi:hypothetical protein SDJN02_14326, partial [Cucurbita argyrosperma subsp. argyrosperma]
MKPNWELKHCCNHEQVVFLITVSVCTVVILALWRTILLKPFKLVTVFLHEASHAIVCKLTCGHVEGIQVHADEGGATQTRDIGSSFWGMLLILASTNLLTSRIAAGCFLVSLLVVLCVAKNLNLLTDIFVSFTTICSGHFVDYALDSSFFLVSSGSCKKQLKCVFFVMLSYLLVTFLLLHHSRISCMFVQKMIVFIVQTDNGMEGKTDPFCLSKLQLPNAFYFIDYYCYVSSVMFFSDIYDDLISRRVHSSDAEKFAEGFYILHFSLRSYVPRSCDLVL